MTLLVNQISPPGLAAPGLPSRNNPPTIAGTSPISVVTTPTLVTISTTTGAYIDGGRKTAPFTAAEGTEYVVASGCVFLLGAALTDGAKIKLSLFNPAALYGIDPNGVKINNSTSIFYLGGGETFEITWDATLGDWE